MNNINKKVIYLTNIPAPYRVDFFNELSKYCQLKVVFYARRIKNMGWKDIEKNHEYDFSYLFSKSKIGWILDLFKLIKNNKEAIFIVGGYSLLPEILAILFLNFLKVDFLLNLDGGFIKQNTLKSVLKRHLIKSAKFCLSSGINTTKTLLHYGALKTNIWEIRFSSIFNSEVLQKPLLSDEKEKLRKKWNLDPSPFYLVFVGQLIHRKGVDILVKAMSEGIQNNIELLIIGDGEMQDELKDLAIENNIQNKIHFLGKKAKNEVLEYLKLSDVFVLPTREDIWGLVVNEAIACGLPVITTKQTGASYSLIKEGENGFVYDCNDVTQLNFYLNKIEEEYDLSYNIVSLSIASEYTIEKMVSDHIELFKRL